MKYAVFINYGFTDEELVAEIEDLQDAIDRAEEEAWNCTISDIIEVATFAADGEYLTHYRVDGKNDPYGDDAALDRIEANYLYDY